MTYELLTRTVFLAAGVFALICMLSCVAGALIGSVLGEDPESEDGEGFGGFHDDPSRSSEHRDHA